MSASNEYPQSRGVNAREHGRGDVQIYADVRERGGGKYKVHIVDLSRSGFRVHTSSYINEEKEVFLTIPGFAPLEATIAWHRGHEYGCRFVNGIHEAIYEHIVKTYPMLAQAS